MFSGWMLLKLAVDFAVSLCLQELLAQLEVHAAVHLVLRLVWLDVLAEH